MLLNGTAVGGAVGERVALERSTQLRTSQDGALLWSIQVGGSSGYL